MDLKCTNKESPEELGSPLVAIWSLGCPSCCLYSRICGLQKLQVRAMVGRGWCQGHSMTMAMPGQEPMSWCPCSRSWPSPCACSTATRAWTTLWRSGSG